MKTGPLADWKEVRLIDVSLDKGQYGSGASAVDYDPGKPRYVRITDIDDDGRLKQEELRSPSEVEKKYLLEYGDFLFARSGSVGRTYLHEEKSGAYQYAGYLIRFRLNQQSILPEYLYYVTKSKYYWNWVTKQQKSVTIANINAQQYASFNFMLPPLDVQHKIVSVLSKAERAKELRKEAEQLTEELMWAIFFQTFGEPGKNRKGFEVSLIRDILAVPPQNGLYKHSSEYTNGKNGTPILRIDSFYDGEIANLSQLKRLKCDQNELKLFALENRNIVINRVNSLEYLGKCALIEGLRETTVFESNMMRLRINEEVMNSQFLTFLLCTPYLKSQILSKAKKAVNQASINQQDVQSLQVIKPPIQLQERFAKTVRAVRQTILNQQLSRDYISNFFDVLMQKSFKGEIAC